MTPNDLYGMTPERVSHDACHLAGGYNYGTYNHVPELGDFAMGALAGAASDRLEIRFLKDWHFDVRRVWQLATVWLDGEPVMIIRNAGREGDDHSSRLVTDAARFKALCEHVRTLLPMPDPPADDVVPADKDVPNLTSFYGNELGGYFERYSH